MLTHVHKSYSQWFENIDRAVQAGKGPLEKRLRDLVKLSKWDDQSYYALQESADKSHRQLFKLAREYDGILSHPVHRILERALEENVQGGQPGRVIFLFGSLVWIPLYCIPSNSLNLGVHLVERSQLEKIVLMSTLYSTNALRASACASSASFPAP